MDQQPHACISCSSTKNIPQHSPRTCKHHRCRLFVAALYCAVDKPAMVRLAIAAHGATSDSCASAGGPLCSHTHMLAMTTSNTTTTGIYCRRSQHQQTHCLQSPNNQLQEQEETQRLMAFQGRQSWNLQVLGGLEGSTGRPSAKWFMTPQLYVFVAFSWLPAASGRLGIAQHPCQQ